MGKIKLLAWPVLTAMLLTGCTSFLEGSYEAVSEHRFAAAEETAAEVITVHTYAALKSAILSMVRDHASSGVIRLQNYDGDPSTDASKAISEVWQSAPLGAFAVEYFYHEKTQILSYYDLTLTINYRRSKEEIDSIISVYTANGVKERLENAAKSFDASIVLMGSGGILEETFLRSILAAYYKENPLAMLLPPQMTVGFYPDMGAQRIAEITLEYGFETAELEEMLAQLQSAAQSVADEIGQRTPEEAVAAIAEVLTARVSLREEDVPDSGKGRLAATAYGALVENTANSQGVAIAYKALCGLLELECAVVEGKLADTVHYWDMVKLEDNWYHIDPMTANGENPVLLWTDVNMLEAGYTWDMIIQAEG